MTHDDDFKAGLDMAKEAEKRGARAKAKKAAPKSAKKTATAKKPAVKTKTAKKRSAATSAPKRAAKPVRAPKAAPMHREPLRPATGTEASVGASLACLEGGLDVWTSTCTKAQDAYFDAGRKATETVIEVARRNLDLQHQFLTGGLALGRALRP